MLPIGDERHFVACKDCRLVLNQSQFLEHGCPHCNPNDDGWTRDDVHDATTNNYTGFIGVIDGQSSWVARLIGKQGAKSAIYAATIHLDDAEDAAADDEDAYENDDAREGTHDAVDDDAAAPVVDDDLLNADEDDFFKQFKTK